MKYTVYANYKVITCDNIDHAIKEGTRHLYISHTGKQQLKDKLLSGENALYSYGWNSVLIVPVK